MLGERWLLLAGLLLLALLVFGPRRLPELGRALGQALHAFRRASQSAPDEARADPVAATPREPGGDGRADAEGGPPARPGAGRSGHLPPAA